MQMEETLRGRRLATGCGLAAILLWSIAVALTRSLSEQLGPVTAGASVYGVSGLLALARLWWSDEERRQLRRLPRAYLVVCSGLFLGYMLLLLFAVGLAANRQQVREGGLLNYLWPPLTLLLAVVLLGKTARLTLAPATLLALAGLFLVLIPNGRVSWASLVTNLARNPVAYTLGFAAAVAWALYSVLTRKWAGGQRTGAVKVFLPATAVAFLFIGCFVDEPRAWSMRTGVEVVVFGTATFLAYGLWDIAMREGNMVVVASASYLTPLLSTVVSCLYLAVTPQPRFWVGCGLLIVGSVASGYSISETKHPNRG